MPREFADKVEYSVFSLNIEVAMSKGLGNNYQIPIPCKIIKKYQDPHLPLFTESMQKKNSDNTWSIAFQSVKATSPWWRRREKIYMFNNETHYFSLALHEQFSGWCTTNSVIWCNEITNVWSQIATFASGNKASCCWWPTRQNGVITLVTMHSIQYSISSVFMI